MRHIHWLTLAIGLVAGYFLGPAVVGAIRGR